MTDRRFPAAAAATLLLTLLTAASASAQTVPAQRREHGNLVFDGVPQPNAALAALLERYQQSRSATFLAACSVAARTHSVTNIPGRIRKIPRSRRSGGTPVLR